MAAALHPRGCELSRIISPFVRADDLPSSFPRLEFPPDRNLAIKIAIASASPTLTSSENTREYFLWDSKLSGMRRDLSGKCVPSERLTTRDLSSRYKLHRELNGVARFSYQLFYRE